MTRTNSNAKEDPAKNIDSKIECRIVKEMGIDIDKKHGKYLL